MSLAEFKGASGLPEGLIHNDPDLTGFGAKIAVLNATPVDSDMITLPIGRAYLNRDPELFPGTTRYYASKIHVAPVGEYNHPEALKHIEAHAQQTPPGLYMGAGGFINMAYIAAAKPKAALLFDVNPLQTLFWNEVIDIIKRTPDVEGFMDIMRNIELHMGYVIMERLGHVYFRGRGLYHSDDNRRADNFPLRETSAQIHFAPGEDPEHVWKKQSHYDHLHEMARTDAIGALTLDVFHTPSWQQLRHALGALKADIVYISNIMSHPGWTGRYDGEDENIRQRGWDHIFMVAKKEGRFINHNGVINLNKRTCLYAPQLGIGTIEP